MRAAMIGAVLALSACARSDLPLPAIPGLSLGKPEEAEITNRVWLDTTPGALRGAFVVFLSDGTMIADSCDELWRLSPWRRVDPTTVVWEEDAVTIRATIAVAGPGELALVVGEGTPGGGSARRYRAAEAPMVCPEPD